MCLWLVPGCGEAGLLAGYNIAVVWVRKGHPDWSQARHAQCTAWGGEQAHARLPA